MGYQTLAGYGWTASVAEGADEAREAAQRALAITPDLAEAHAALGRVLTLLDWDRRAADAELRRALALAPGNVHVLGAASDLASQLGRHDEAVNLARRRVELDPLSTSAQRDYSLVCMWAGRLDEAKVALETVLQLDPQSGLAWSFLGQVHLLQGSAQQSLDLSRRELLPLYRNLGIALAEHALGHVAESEAALQTMIAEDSHDAAYQIAEVYAYRGETDKAFEWLERSYEQRDPGLGWTAIDPLLTSLMNDPRMPPLLEKAGLT